MAVYSCIGFAGGFIGTLLFGVALDWFGGTAPVGGLGGGIRYLRDCLPTTVLLALAYPPPWTGAVAPVCTRSIRKMQNED